MLSLKVLTIELAGEDDTCAAYCLRISKGSGLHEYATSTKPKDKSKRKTEFDDGVDILYGEQEEDPLLVVSLLGAWEDKSQQVISVLYLSIPQLLKKQVRLAHQEHLFEFKRGHSTYTARVKVAADDRMRRCKFGTIQVRDTKVFGEDFGYLNFSAVTFEFVKCITPLRMLYENAIILLSWTAPFRTVLFLCAISFVVCYLDWILLLFGLCLWTPVRHAVLGSLIVIEIPEDSDRLVEEFRKNLTFIQLLEASLVDAVNSLRQTFSGVQRNRLQAFISCLKILPVFGLLVMYLVPGYVKVLAVLSVWLLTVSFHPFGTQVWKEVANRYIEYFDGSHWKKPMVKDEAPATPAQEPGLFSKVVEKVSTITSQASQPRVIKDLFVFENQRWWLGMGFVPKFFLDGRAG